MRPGDRLVCAFINDPPAEFKDWPLHITIVPWFRNDVASADLAAELDESLANCKNLQATVGSETTFGHDKTVNLIALPTPLTEIEEATRKLLKKHDSWLVDETTKRRRDYQPHVTAQKSGRLYQGDCFVVENLYIVEQKGNHKEVVARVDLQK